MHSLRSITRRSVRRSRNRDAVLLALYRLGRATVHELARASGVPPHRVLLVLHGDDVDYARELSLVALGLARWRRTRIGVQVELTEKGRVEAAAIADARAGARLL